MEIRAALETFRNNLSGLYPPEEIESFITLLFEHLFKLSRIQLHFKQHEIIPEAKLTQLKEILDRLGKFEPIQYILGETEFYGLKFKVNSSVLIPRPETEELVDWILKDSPQQDASLLDIGTGSGCIPVAITKNRTDLRTEGWDVSIEALNTAHENAILNKVTVNFSKVDILDWCNYPADVKFDIIVSNPPYVTRSEESLMLKNVTEHEPHLAVFVPDENALVFYQAIAAFSEYHLNAGGCLYFEINERMGGAVERLLRKHFSTVTVKKDINGKDRMVKACL